VFKNEVTNMISTIMFFSEQKKCSIFEQVFSGTIESA